MSPYLPVFTSPAGEAEWLAAYQAVINRWTVPYEELNIPTSFGDTHVIASGSPEKPPLVFLHALFATAAVWYPNAGCLSQYFRTYAVDVIGEANLSRPTCRVASLVEIAQWFGELLDRLGIRQTYLVGNSFGAFMSAYFAIRLPERVRRMVLIAPAATFHSIFPFYIHALLPKALYSFFPKLPGQKRMMRYTINWVQAGLPPDPAWSQLFYLTLLYGSMTNQIFPKVFSKEEFSQIRAPTLLLIGEQEKIYRPEDAIRAARQLMPNLQAQTVPNAHHITALAQPEIVNNRILQFFNEAGSGDEDDL